MLNYILNKNKDSFNTFLKKILIALQKKKLNIYINISYLPPLGIVAGFLVCTRAVALFTYI